MFSGVDVTIELFRSLLIFEVPSLGPAFGNGSSYSGVLTQLGPGNGLVAVAPLAPGNRLVDSKPPLNIQEGCYQWQQHSNDGRKVEHCHGLPWVGFHPTIHGRVNVLFQEAGVGGCNGAGKTTTRCHVLSSS